MEEEKNLTSLEIKQIDLSLSEDVKEYLNFCEFIGKICETTCGLPQEKIQRNKNQTELVEFQQYEKVIKSLHFIKELK